MEFNSNNESPYLPFSSPTIGQEEKDEIVATLDSDWLTTGPRTIAFEKAFASYVGTATALAVNSCTAALHLALAALDIGPSDAVVTTPFTFAATANVIVHRGAYPVFVDIEPTTYTLDTSKLQDLLERQCTWNSAEHSLILKRNGRRIRAIIPVHYGGHPCEMDDINALAQKFGLAVIEDAAHALGAEYRDRNAGTLGTVACFSFYANKNMTTAEGGMLTTDDPALADRARVLSLHGISKDGWARYSKEGSWRYDVTEAGFKYNMPDLAAALGLHQLKKVDRFNARRKQLASLYEQAFTGTETLRLPTTSPHCHSAWHLYPVQVYSPGVTRDEVLVHLRNRNIGASVHFIPLHLMSYYRRAFGYQKGDFPVCENVFEHIISLPLFPRMQDGDVTRVAEELKSFLLTRQVAVAS